MKKTTKLIVMAVLCLTVNTIQAQEPSLKNQAIIGKIISAETREALPGAIIKITNTNQTLLSNDQGEFILSLSKGNYNLTVHYLNYKTKSINIQIPLKKPLLILLDTDENPLDEVQIIGYGSTSRRLNTGSISTIKAKDIENQPVSNPLAVLQGRVPGMVISQTSGVAGSSFKVQIRGQSSLDLSLSQNNPLFIIDGVPFESGNTASNQIYAAANDPTSISNGGLSPLNSINPQSIESIDVLKDADATAIYGSRGANGVILITTKRGKPGATNFNVNLYSGFSKVGRTMDMLNTQQYVQMRKEAILNDGNTISNNVSSPGYAPDIMLWDTIRYTDFKKLLIGHTAHSNNLQASISGGSINTRFLINGSYHKESTVYAGNFSDQIGSLNFNINHSSNDTKFSISLSGIYSSDLNKMPRTDLTRYINLPPNLRLYEPSGNLSWEENGIAYKTISGLSNPLANLNEAYSSLNTNATGNLLISYKLLPNLLFKTSLGYSSFGTEESTFRPKAAIDPSRGEFPSAIFANSSNLSWIIEPQATYHLDLKQGKLNFLIGGTLQAKSGKRMLVNGTNYSSDLLLNSISAAGNISGNNDENQYRYNAFFGRANYNYKDKYLINLSARRDGSSRFGPDKQWANFGAAGLAWIFSNENYIQNHFPFISYGKLRSSYGTTGNDQIGDYKFLNLWNSTYTPYNGLSGLYPNSLYNPDYNWEINKKFEVAIELGLFKDRFLLSAAYYRNHSKNQLISYSLPAQTGFFQVIKNFPGLVQNSGLEMVLSTNHFQFKAFKWSSALNFTIPKNKLISFPGLNSSSYKNTYVIGKSLSVIRALKYTGVDPQTGLYDFEDQQADGLISTDDFQILGNQDPKFYGGLQNNLSYKQFELSFFFDFRKQTGVNYLAQLGALQPGAIANQPTFVLNRWQKPGDITEVQKYGSSFYSKARTAAAYLSLSDGKYTDASFIRFKNIALSYQLKNNALSKLHLDGCKFYVEMQNLFTITNYKGADPENQNFYVLPPLKTIVFGMQLNF